MRFAAALDSVKQEEECKKRLATVGALFEDDDSKSFEQFLRAQDEIWDEFSNKMKVK